MSNNNSIWFVEGPSGRQYYSQDKPERRLNGWRESPGCAELIYLHPPLSIQAITGRTLTWADEPIEWKPGEETKHICRVCGSEKTYETKAYHCNHCAITTEI